MLSPKVYSIHYVLLIFLLCFVGKNGLGQSYSYVSTDTLYPQLYAAEPGSDTYQKIIFKLMDAGRSNQPDSTIKYCLLSLKHNPKERQPHHFHAGYMLSEFTRRNWSA